MLVKYDTQIYANTRQWKAYQKVTLSQADTYFANDSKQLIDMATNYLNHIQDPAALVKAIEWTQKAIAISENAEKHLLTAKLFLKLKDPSKALEAAQKAKRWSTNMGWSTTESDSLIQEINTIKK